ncbi:MAG: VOC family protein [Alphaproteobacteria bacterium]
MTAIPDAQISHVGIYVTDLDRMVDFYVRVLGFTVTDRGPLPSMKGTPGAPEYVFMSRNPEEHHQLVFVPGRPADAPSQIVQLSLKVRTLADLRTMHEIVTADAEAHDIQTRAHGVAWSMYFKDPEENTVEAFTPSPWYVNAPSAVPFDFDAMTDEEIFDHVAAAIRDMPGFSSYDDWRKRAAAEMGPNG